MSDVSKPLVYACAGASFAAGVTYDLARELARRGHAEMSCLAGVGAGKRPFLRKMEGREIWVIDGCPIECGLGIFARIGCMPDLHLRLHHDLGIPKHEEPAGGIDLDALVGQVLELAEERREPASAQRLAARV